MESSAEVKILIVDLEQDAKKVLRLAQPLPASAHLVPWLLQLYDPSGEVSIYTHQLMLLDGDQQEVGPLKNASEICQGRRLKLVHVGAVSMPQPLQQPPTATVSMQSMDVDQRPPKQSRMETTSPPLLPVAQTLPYVQPRLGAAPPVPPTPFAAPFVPPVPPAPPVPPPPPPAPAMPAILENGAMNVVESGRLHPCLRVYGFCKYGDACTFALYPYDTCLSHLKQKCRFASKCHERHVDFVGKLQELPQPERDALLSMWMGPDFTPPVVVASENSATSRPRRGRRNPPPYQEHRRH